MLYLNQIYLQSFISGLSILCEFKFWMLKKILFNIHPSCFWKSFSLQVRIILHTLLVVRLGSQLGNRVEREHYWRQACTLFEYMNGGQQPRECAHANVRRLPSSFSASYKHEMCASRDLRARSVFIPAKFPFFEEEAERKRLGWFGQATSTWKSFLG